MLLERFHPPGGPQVPCEKDFVGFGILSNMLGQLLRLFLPKTTERKRDPGGPPSPVRRRAAPQVRHAPTRIQMPISVAKEDTVSSRNFNSRYLKSRVSNPRTIAYVRFEMPFESSNLPGARPIFPD